MSSPASGSAPDGYSLLRAFLQPQAASGRTSGAAAVDGSALQRRLPTGGTLPWFERRWAKAGLPAALLSVLRSLGQVIFINNPVSGLLLLLALLLQSPWMALFAVTGTVTANLTARAFAAEPTA